MQIFSSAIAKNSRCTGGTSSFSARCRREKMRRRCAAESISGSLKNGACPAPARLPHSHFYAPLTYYSTVCPDLQEVWFRFRHHSTGNRYSSAVRTEQNKCFKVFEGGRGTRSLPMQLHCTQCNCCPQKVSPAYFPYSSVLLRTHRPAIRRAM